MKRLNEARNIFLIIMLTTLLSSYELVAADILFRKIQQEQYKQTNRIQVIKHDDCFAGRGGVKIDIQNQPLFIIPHNQIESLELFHDICIDTPYTTLTIKVKPEIQPVLSSFTKKYLNSQVALFFDHDYISNVPISVPVNDSFNHSSCLSYEKATILILNNDFVPNYEMTCIGGKRNIIELSTQYKFQDHYIVTHNLYNQIINNSEFWYLLHEANVFNKSNGEVIARIPQGKIVEQYFNEKKGTFEREGNWIKISHNEKTAWIHQIDAIPFFSTLNTNLFLQKFFTFNELRYQNLKRNRSAYSDYMSKRVKSIRKAYVQEALGRFKNRDEFARWYKDTFDLSFQDDSLR